ncbi:DNA helicase [Streptomyces sp. NPDC012616]|uniref:DNA helicase n=1 Tax=Streptomyces sp. NPDC012616 TaxID=3364840 RepID=UPI0036EFE4C5
MLALTGASTVLLTRSNLLRQSLDATVHELGPADPSVRVATAHAWLTERYGGQPPRGADGWFDWPNLFECAVETGPVPGLTLVVDEGQDLPPEFYRLCRLLGARTTVFADECQRLTDANSTLAEIVERLGRCTRLALDGNHRNTRQIASLAAHFHTGTGLPAVPERDGPPPRLHRLPHGGAADLLILLAQRRPQQTIGVIVNSTHTQFSLLGCLERRAPRLKAQLYTSRARATQGLCRWLDLGRPGIVLVHRASVKGQGFDTVVIPDTHIRTPLSIPPLPCCA